MQKTAERLILMFAVEYRVVITLPAQRDLRDILSYSLQIWGEKQLKKYRNNIDITISEIKQNPQIGRKKGKHSVYAMGKHDFYYRVEDDKIIILRVLHNRMDASLRL